MIREEVLRTAGEPALVGIAGRPEAPASERWGVVLLNAGLVHRVGPARLWVTLARRLCELGHATYRVDFSGIGDSPEAAQDSRFEARAPQEARSAIDALAAATGAGSFVLLGLCSGAEIAFKTALVDPRVRALVLVNAPRFLEEPSAELVGRLERRQASRYYWRVALRSPRSWWKALTGRADLGAMARAALASWRRSPARSGASEDTGDAQAFRLLLGRGVKLHLVLSEGDWAQDYLRAVLGEAMEARLEIAVIPASDHLLTPLHAQRALVAQVERWSASWS